MVDDIRTILGELVITFAELDDSLTDGFAQIVNIDYLKATIILKYSSFRNKVQLVEDLLKQHYPDKKDLPIYALLSKADKLRKKRNDLIHSSWVDCVRHYEKEDGDYSTFMKQVKLERKKTEKAKIIHKEVGCKEQEEFRETIREIEVCTDELIGEFGQIGSDLEREFSPRVSENNF